MASKVIIVGSDRVEALESSYARAFRSLDWQVHLWDPERALNRVVRGGRPGRLFGLFVHVEAWQRKANLDLLRLAHRVQPDLILVIATKGVRVGTLAQLRAHLPRIQVYCVFPDSPHSLDGERIDCLPVFDRVTTSSPAWVAEFAGLGARKVDYLPFAADTVLYKPSQAVKHNQDFAHDVAFIGTWRLERELFLEQLACLDLRIWGSRYWKSRTRRGSPLKRCWAGGQAIGAEFAQICAQSKVLLNILDLISWPGPNMRTFELPACRAFPLAERSPCVLDLFHEGETIECFGTAEEALEKIDYYCSHETDRQRIAAAAYQFVMEGGHTYRDRAEQLVRWFAADSARAQAAVPGWGRP